MQRIRLTALLTTCRKLHCLPAKNFCRRPSSTSTSAERFAALFKTNRNDVSTCLRKMAPFACCGHLRKGGLGPNLQVQGLGDVSTSPFMWGLATAPPAAIHPMHVSSSRCVPIDANICNAVEFNPHNYQVTPGRAWQEELSSILAEVHDALELSEVCPGVTAELQRSLLFKEGSFVKRYSSDRATGGVGSLLIFLPSTHSGGEVIMWHHSSSQRYGAEELPADCVSYVAFRPGCEYEVRKLQYGYRVCLEYKLLPQQKDYVLEQLEMSGFTPVLQRISHLLDRARQLDSETEMALSSAQVAASTEAAPPCGVNLATGAAAHEHNGMNLLKTLVDLARQTAHENAALGTGSCTVSDIRIAATLCRRAAADMASRLLQYHQAGGTMSSSQVAQLLSLLIQLPQPRPLVQQLVTGPLKAAAQYAASCIQTAVADNGHSVCCVVTATGTHFMWEELAAALLDCCDVIDWDDIKGDLLPVIKQYLVTVRILELHNPLTFEYAYGQVLALALQLVGLPLRDATAAALAEHCIKISNAGTSIGGQHNQGHMAGQLVDRSSVEAAAKAAEAVMAADGVLPSPRALSDLHTSVSCDLTPDQMMSGVLSGLPGWQIQMCKDMLEALLEAMAGEDAGRWPMETYRRHPLEDELPVIHAPRDAGLLVSLLQVVYALGTQQQLQQLVQHVTRQPRLYDPAATVAPAALEFCCWLGDSRLAESPGAVQLLQDCLTALQQLTEGGPPDDTTVRWVVSTKYLRLCRIGRSSTRSEGGCIMCAQVRHFLADGRAQRWTCKGARRDREHLKLTIPPYSVSGALWGGSHQGQEAVPKCCLRVLSDVDDIAHSNQRRAKRGRLVTSQSPPAAAPTARPRTSASLPFPSQRGRPPARTLTNMGPSSLGRGTDMGSPAGPTADIVGVLTLQKKDGEFKEHVQQYQNHVGLLSTLQAVAARLDPAAPVAEDAPAVAPVAAEAPLAAAGTSAPATAPAATGLVVHQQPLPSSALAPPLPLAQLAAVLTAVRQRMDAMQAGAAALSAAAAQAITPVAAAAGNSAAAAAAAAAGLDVHQQPLPSSPLTPSLTLAQLAAVLTAASQRVNAARAGAAAAPTAVPVLLSPATAVGRPVAVLRVPRTTVVSPAEAVQQALIAAAVAGIRRKRPRSQEPASKQPLHRRTAPVVERMITRSMDRRSRKRSGIH